MLQRKNGKHPKRLLGSIALIVCLPQVPPRGWDESEGIHFPKILSLCPSGLGRYTPLQRGIPNLVEDEIRVSMDSLQGMFEFRGAGQIAHRGWPVCQTDIPPRKIMRAKRLAFLVLGRPLTDPMC